jgi:hypothetical protein
MHADPPYDCGPGAWERGAADWGDPAECVLPVQGEQTPPTGPLQRLQWAVLEDGMRLALNGRPGSLRQREALAWVWAPHEDDYPFAFLTLCAALSIDPGHLRRAVGAGVRLRRTNRLRGRPTRIGARARAA